MRRHLAIAASLLALSIASCGTDTSEKNTPTEAVNPDTTEAIDEQQAQQEADAMARIGEQEHAGGVTLTVNSVEESATVSLYARGYKRGYLPDEVVEAPAGAKYVTVHSTVTNDTDGPWDLTCGLAIRAVLATPTGTTYEPEGDQYRIHDNPECNDTLGPGLSSPMSWMFIVPADVTPGALGFSDGSDFTSKLTLVALLER